jgi:mannosyltransferase OCH1-like enzyme
MISNLERLKFDEKSIILINHYISNGFLEKIWHNIPSGSYILVSNNSVISESILTINCETISGEIRKVHLVKKKEESEKYEFKNIPYKFSEVKNKTKLGIPKIVHHIAHSDSNKWFPNWNQCYQTWIKHFPDFEHKIWDDDDIIKLIDEEFPWYKDIYLSYDRPIKRYDVARPLILYKFGGIYADMDYITFENFYDLMPHDKISTPISPYRYQEYIQNALFVSPQNHPFWLMYIDFTIDRLHIREVLKSTGPIAISDCFYENYSICKKWFNILPDKIYNPNPNSPDIASPDIKTRHLCTNTWTSKVRPGLLLEDKPYI